ncbi:UNVERIFIED_CONTAM: hypothetical protein FKN15_067377 [Acipenser sinensis]
MLADVGQRLIFPPDIDTSNLRPDIVLWSGSACLVHLEELTVQWEDAVEEVYERKKLRNQAAAEDYLYFSKPEAANNVPNRQSMQRKPTMIRIDKPPNRSPNDADCQAPPPIPAYGPVGGFTGSKPKKPTIASRAARLDNVQRRPLDSGSGIGIHGPKNPRVLGLSNSHSQTGSQSGNGI